MFKGIKTFNLEKKGRMAIPSHYREELRLQEAGQVILTLNPFERCLWLYPRSQWSEVAVRLADLSDTDANNRNIKRRMRGYATDCVMDGQGRVLIPKMHRDYAKLQTACLFSGQGNKFEIWDVAMWNENEMEFLQALDAGDPQISDSLKHLSL